MKKNKNDIDQPPICAEPTSAFAIRDRDLKLLLTEQEAALALGISRRTLWTLRNTGQVPSIRIGKCVRYSVAALKEWIEKRNQNPKPNLPR